MEIKKMNTSPIARFFDTFSQRSNCDNVQAHLAQFAETFLAAGPQGAKCVSAADFATALPKRKQLFDSLGCQSTRLVSLDEVPLDARYVMVRTRWQMTFGRRDSDPEQVLADSTFIVDTGSEEFKIVLYLANQDIMQVLRDRGIVKA
jgi:hypothetical protein